MGERLKMFSEKIPHMLNHVPGPGYKPKDRHLYNESGLNRNHRSFSTGLRQDLSKPSNENPGPEFYMIKRFPKEKKTNKTVEY